MQKSMIRLVSIADVISITNALLGFLSILMIFSNNFRLAYSFIFLALIADGLDGIIARRYNVGILGENLECTADMISMGIAPAIFVYIMYSDVFTTVIEYFFVYVTLIVFISLSIVRLSSFHVMKKKEVFVGLPASAATIIIMVLSYIKIDFVYILLVILFVSLLMISNIDFPKTGLKINSIAAILIVFNIMMGKQYYSIAPIMLLIGTLIYVTIGSLYIWQK